MITLDKTKGKDIAKVSIILIISLLVLTLILNFIPAMFENATLERYDYDTTLADMHISIANNLLMTFIDTTLADMHISIANNLLMTFITFLYVLLTVVLVTQSKEQVAQSKVEVEQLKKEQKIRDIENRLENFYMPAQSTLKVAVEFLKDTIHFTKSLSEKSVMHVEKLQ
jgi:Ca2+/Na+ antiporter